MNLTILKGHLGQDPVIRTFEWGKTASFSLATTESYPDKKTGERITVTDWHNIVFTGPVVDVIEKHLKKGSEIVVTGKIKYRKYDDKNGETKYITEIKCDSFEFCGSKEKEQKNEALTKEDILNLPDDGLSDLPFN